MIDPTNITKFDRTDIELEELILFCVLVAGKMAIPTAKRLNNLLKYICKSKKLDFMPFECIKSVSLKDLEILLLQHGIGCYRFKAKALKDLVNVNLNLKTCSIEDLEKIYGIGPKTSRFFILHSRVNVKVACLDTHILKFLSKNHKVPKSTPNGKKYLELEKVFLKYAEESGMSVADYDLFLWKNYSGNV